MYCMIFFFYSDHLMTDHDLKIVMINHEFLITNVGENALFKQYNEIHFICLIQKKSHGQQ